MKILKILLVLLIPAMGIVGCCKSNAKPKKECGNTESTVTAPENTNNENAQRAASGENTSAAVSTENTESASQSAGTTNVDDANNTFTTGKTAAKGTEGGVVPGDSGTEVISTGDDDRDGGDKKKKK